MMRRWVVSLFVLLSGCGVVLVAGSVEAAPLLQDTDTPTPTVTDTPVPTATITAPSGDVVSTATPAPTISDIYCPPGLPLGAGTVTPSSRWRFLCGQCLAGPTGTPTTTQGPSTPVIGTATATATKTKTPTVVPTGAYGVTFDVAEISVNAGVQYGYDAIGLVVPGELRAIVWRVAETWYSSNKVGAATGSGNLIHGSTTAWDGPEGIWYCWAKSGVTSYCNQAPVTWESIPGGGPGAPAFYTPTVGGSGVGWWAVENTPCCSWPNPAHVHIEVYYVWWMATPLPTATATVTGVPPDWAHTCGSVEPDTPAFSWTGLVYGSSTCYDIGPYDIPLVGESYDIPWLAHVCFQGVSMGGLVVFGAYILLDSILMILAGVALVFGLANRG